MRQNEGKKMNFIGTVFTGELKNYYSKHILVELKPAIRNAWMHDTRLPRDNTRMPWMPEPAIRAGYPIAILRK